ncbi:hypothetical protein Tco_0410205 [Tanacetum coccineum]
MLLNDIAYRLLESENFLELFVYAPKCVSFPSSSKKSSSSMEIFNEDSDTDEDEVFLPNDGNSFPSSSGGGRQTLEEDMLNAYDDYEDQFEEYPSSYQEFYDQFDFKTLFDVISGVENTSARGAKEEASMGWEGSGWLAFSGVRDNARVVVIFLAMRLFPQSGDDSLDDMSMMLVLVSFLGGGGST